MDSAVQMARATVPAGCVYADWAARPLVVPNSLASGAPLWQHPNSTSGNFRPHALARHALQQLLLGGRDTHDIVLTSGTTSALALIAARLPWTEKDLLVCHTHAHNALLGLRGPARASGALYVAADSAEFAKALNGSPASKRVSNVVDIACGDIEGPKVQGECDRPRFAVLAFPGECNLTGAIYPVSDWARAAHERDLSSSGLKIPPNHCVLTLVDAAALAASTPIPAGLLNHVDMLVCSVYKITGSPTGLGALLVRRRSHAARLLLETSKSSYFAGGRSVKGVSATDESFFLPATSVIDSLELGTPNLEAIERLPSVFTELEEVVGGMGRVHKQACRVANLLRGELVSAFPDEGVAIHRDGRADEVLDMGYGPIVSFSLFQLGTTGEGIPIGHREVEQVLGLNGVIVRAGCMCNPGACAEVLGLTNADVQRHFNLGHRCDDDMDVIDGRHTGVVRASFGWASLDEDAIRIATILREQWGTRPMTIRRKLSGHMAGFGRSNNLDGAPARSGRIVALYVYPVKGCLGEAVDCVHADVDESGLCTGGIRGDRILGILSDESEEILNRKSCPALDRIRASIREKEVGSRLLLVTLEVVDKLKAGESLPRVCVDIEVDGDSGAVISELEESRAWLLRHAGVRGELRSALDVGGSKAGDVRRSLAMRGSSVHIVSEGLCRRVASELRGIGGGWDAAGVATAARANIVVRWTRDHEQGRWGDASSRSLSSPSSASFPSEELDSEAEALLLLPHGDPNAAATSMSSSSTMIAAGGARLTGAAPCRRCAGMNRDDGEPLRTIVRLSRGAAGRAHVLGHGPVQTQAQTQTQGQGGRRASTCFGLVARWATTPEGDVVDRRRGRSLRVGEALQASPSR